jgi:tetratricopeptide (TPR) repeat protein
MLNQYEEAKQIFKFIISNYPDTDAGILAWKLLDFLVAMEKKREMLEKEELSAFAGGKQRYFLMDYKSSITLFSGFLKQEPNNLEAAEAHYYKGRSHEELGEIEEALNEYNLVIRFDEDHKWALESNRRLFMIGEFYKDEPQIAERARDYLAAHKDYSFINNIEEYTESINSSYIAAHMPLEQIEETVEILPIETHTEKIIYTISPGAEADITGESLEVDIAPKTPIENSDIEQGRVLLQEINTSGYSDTKLKYGMESLIEKAVTGQKEEGKRRDNMNALSAERVKLRKKLAGIIKQRKRNKLKTLISYGIGVSALGGMGVALYFGNDAYNRYKEAEYTEDAVALREETQTYQKIAITTGIIGGIGIAAGTLFRIFSPKPDQIQSQINSIEEQIELLKRQSSD